MKKLEFVKATASGNDFMIIDGFKNRLPFEKKRLSYFAKSFCQRRQSVGADGLLVLEHSRKADLRMRIFNPDGGEVDMCGNGSRCVAIYAVKSKIASAKGMHIETRAGTIKAIVRGDKARIMMTDPKDLRLGFDLDVDGNTYNANFIDTGVPHVVCFTQRLDKFNVPEMGRAIRYHSEFQPAGTNADFVEVQDKGRIRLRTYERGVEAETLACGTGCVASAIITTYDMQKRPKNGRHKVKVATKGGEVLTVYFNVHEGGIDRVFLEGGARIVFEGRISE